MGPAVWLLVLLAPGLGLLYLGASRVWFVSMLGAASFPVEEFHLAWMLFGTGYCVLASVACFLLGRRALTWKVVFPFLVALVPMLVGSQVAALYVRGNLVTGIAGFRWEPGAQEFVLDVVAPPGAVHAFERGGLVPVAFVKGGIGGTVPFQVGDIPHEARTILLEECGDKLIMARSRTTVDSLQPGEVVSIRVPWEGEPSYGAVIYVREVQVVLANRQGKGISGLRFAPLDDSFHFGSRP